MHQVIGKVTARVSGAVWSRTNPSLRALLTRDPQVKSAAQICSSAQALGP